MTSKKDTESALVSDSFSLSNQMWIEKYRPKTLDEITAHADIVATIRQLTHDRKLPHLLLYGPPGTGKTSIILALARELYSTSFAQMTLELNASDERGIDVVREEIHDFASTLRASSFGFKLVILDESDSMTKDAQFALRRIIERYTKYTRFCLICNFPSKIIPGRWGKQLHIAFWSPHGFGPLWYRFAPFSCRVALFSHRFAPFRTVPNRFRTVVSAKRCEKFVKTCEQFAKHLRKFANRLLYNIMTVKVDDFTWRPMSSTDMISAEHVDAGTVLCSL